MAKRLAIFLAIFVLLPCPLNLRLSFRSLLLSQIKKLQAHTKAVQLAKKGQVSNVLPSCKLNETSMLRLQTEVQSTSFPKKKSARLENLSKPPQGASKLASFDTVLAVRTLGVTFFFLSRTCSCRLSASLPSHLTSDQLVLSNTVLQPNKKAFRQPSG